MLFVAAAIVVLIKSNHYLCIETQQELSGYIIRGTLNSNFFRLWLLCFTIKNQDPTTICTSKC